MRMNTHVYGFKPPDDYWKAMKKIWDACHEAKIDPPEKVGDFFDWQPPEDNGVKVDEDWLTQCGALEEYRGAGESGHEIIVANLPKDVKVIRVWNSW